MRAGQIFTRVDSDKSEKKTTEYQGPPATDSGWRHEALLPRGTGVRPKS